MATPKKAIQNTPIGGNIDNLWSLVVYHWSQSPQRGLVQPLHEIPKAALSQDHVARKDAHAVDPWAAGGLDPSALRFR